MKKTLLNMVMTLGAVAMLTACGGSSTDSSDDTTCTLTQVSVAETNMTVNAQCSSNVNINTATVTADSVVKTPTIAGTSIDENITFTNLQTGTLYPVVLDVVAGVDVVSTTLNVSTINAAPTWTASSYASGVTVTDADDTVKVIKDMNGLCTDADGDAITISEGSVTTQATGDNAKMQSSLFIDSGIIKIQNLMTNDPAITGTITLTVNCSATGGSDSTDVSFTFTDVQ